ncbi:unnamed protein product [Chrysodeixis includens]|uniref:Uncharacterized protein n=1 Tax=Chrysodeixis includens TaxID=689277 RepID=A0A9N8PYC9_CHRIL|nr:unnamed protein product [Chrysodeixis includens]
MRHPEPTSHGGQRNETMRNAGTQEHGGNPGPHGTNEPQPHGTNEPSRPTMNEATATNRKIWRQPGANDRMWPERTQPEPMRATRNHGPVNGRPANGPSQRRQPGANDPARATQPQRKPQPRTN